MRILMVMLAVFAFGSRAQAQTAAQKCEAGKIAAVGKFEACLSKAEKKFVLSGDGTKYTDATGKCSEKLAGTWAKLEQKAVDNFSSCPSVLDQADIEDFITRCEMTVAAGLGGAPLTPDLLATNIRLGRTILGVTGTLDPGTTTLPATGQTVAYGTGSDGDVQGGSTLSFTDNGDGTITDNNTGLMWEKKDDSGGLHDKDNVYTWSGASYNTTNATDGTLFTTFLAMLNTGPGFAGHTDWRIPNIKELQGILDFSLASAPMLSSEFHHSATCTGCNDVTLMTCSCSPLGYSWSSSSALYGAGDGHNAWLIRFDIGNTEVQLKTPSNSFSARAVRGGV